MQKWGSRTTSFLTLGCERIICPRWVPQTTCPGTMLCAWLCVTPPYTVPRFKFARITDHPKPCAKVIPPNCTVREHLMDSRAPDDLYNRTAHEQDLGFGNFGCSRLRLRSR